MTTRRRFLASVSAGAAGLAGAQWRSDSGGSLSSTRPLDSRLTDRPFRLAMAAYSFRTHFEFNKGQPQSPPDNNPMNMFRFIDYCADQNCGAELTSYFFPPNADDEYFLRVKRHAFVNGVPIVGTAIGNNFTIGRGEKLNQQIANAKQWIGHAATLGAPHVRFFAGTRQQLESAPEIMSTAIESLQSCVDFAAKKGIFVGVENHGKLTAAQVLEIIKGVQSEWFGVNLDTGNFISDDPYRDIELCAPFAVNVQLKVKMKTPDNESVDADFARIAAILSAAKYRGPVVLEFEEPQPFSNVPEAMDRMREAFGVSN